MEGKKCEIERNYTKSHFTCSSYPRFKEKYNANMIKNEDENLLHYKVGDWKYEEDPVKDFLPEKMVHKPASFNSKLKTLYSTSNFNRTDQSHRDIFCSENDISTNMLQDVWHKIDSHDKDSAKVEKINYLQNIRECLANYQESYGIPRTEYSFSALIKIMGQATGRSLLALLYVMLNMIPVAEIFLYVLRFILDKIISIRSSNDVRHTMVRCFVFMIELFSVYICLLFVFGFIVFPIVQMIFGITAKIMLYN
ncbi:uncharacterized protein LOC116428759 [Nomia melanderi]|uniref:uncharacterized protein LOC116428759 n=1 Tax=Nomia melanderi TaxID=2448451 RepID=UPI003FCDCEB1